MSEKIYHIGKEMNAKTTCPVDEEAMFNENVHKPSGIGAAIYKYWTTPMTPLEHMKHNLLVIQVVFDVYVVLHFFAGII